MKTTIEQAAKLYNSQIRKEIKIMQGSLTAGKNKNEWLKQKLKDLTT